MGIISAPLDVSDSTRFTPEAVPGMTAWLVNAPRGEGSAVNAADPMTKSMLLAEYGFCCLEVMGDIDGKSEK